MKNTLCNRLVAALTLAVFCAGPSVCADEVTKARLGSLRRDDLVVVDVQDGLSSNMVSEIVQEYDRTVVIPRESAIYPGVDTNAVQGLIDRYDRDVVQPREEAIPTGVDPAGVTNLIQHYDRTVVQPREAEIPTGLDHAAVRDLITGYDRDVVQPREAEIPTGVSQASVNDLILHYDETVVQPREAEIPTGVSQAGVNDLIASYDRDVIAPREIRAGTVEDLIAQYDRSTIAPREMQDATVTDLITYYDRTVVQPREAEIAGGGYVSPVTSVNSYTGAVVLAVGDIEGAVSETGMADYVAAALSKYPQVAEADVALPPGWSFRRTEASAYATNDTGVVTNTYPVLVLYKDGVEMWRSGIGGSSSGGGGGDMLRPEYTDVPTYRIWSVRRNGIDVSDAVEPPRYVDGRWYVSYYGVDSGDAAGGIGPTPSEAGDAITVRWSSSSPYADYIATGSQRTDISGYILGAQSDKPLQPKGDYAPATGITASALDDNVQASLGRANTAYQLPRGGIPLTDLSAEARNVYSAFSYHDTGAGYGPTPTALMLKTDDGHGRTHGVVIGAVTDSAGDTVGCVGTFIDNEAPRLITIPHASGTFSRLEDIAAEYSATNTYVRGSMCVYGGKLYRCTSDTSSGTTPGGPSSSYWTETTVQDVLSDSASSADMKLSPYYSGDGSFSEWTVSPATYNGEKVAVTYGIRGGLPGYYVYGTTSGNALTSAAGSKNSLQVEWRNSYGVSLFVATRQMVNQVIGYTLGNQVDKPLASVDYVSLLRYYPDYDSSVSPSSSQSPSAQALRVARTSSESGVKAFAADDASSFVVSGLGEFTKDIRYDYDLDTMQATVRYFGANSGNASVVVIPPFVSRYGTPYASSKPGLYTVSAFKVGGGGVVGGILPRFVTDAILPATVTNILYEGFHGWGSLRTAYMPGVRSLGYSALRGCTNLVSVTAPNLTFIGEGAFRDCSSLSSISLPNVTDIDDFAFYDSELSDVFAPNATKIGSYALSCDSLRSVSLPAFTGQPFFRDGPLGGYTKYPQYIFRGCTNLTEVSLPALRVVSDGMFDGCYKLASIDLPQVTAITNGGFFNCRSLKELYLPRLEIVGAGAFKQCYALEHIDMPSVKEVDSAAFELCTNVVSVSLPAAVSVNVRAFYRCDKLSSLYLPRVTTLKTYDNWGPIDGAFTGITGLTSLSLPAATNLPHHAIKDCTSLKTVYIPSVSYIGEWAFENCGSLESIDFGATPRESIPVLQNVNAFSGVTNTCKIIVPYAQYDAWRSAKAWSTLERNGYQFVRHDEPASRPSVFVPGHVAEIGPDGEYIDSGTDMELRYHHGGFTDWEYTGLPPGAENVDLRWWPEDHMFELLFNIGSSKYYAYASPEGSYDETLELNWFFDGNLYQLGLDEDDILATRSFRDRGQYYCLGNQTNSLLLAAGPDYAVRSDLDGLAPSASPVLTGTPLAPSPTAQSTNTQVATAGYVKQGVYERADAIRAALASGFTDWRIELDGPSSVSASDLVVDRVSDSAITKWAVFRAGDPDRSAASAVSAAIMANADVTAISWTDELTSLGVGIRASRTAVPRMTDLDKLDKRLSDTRTSLTNYIGWLENYATNNNRMAYMANSRVKDVELWQYTNSVTRADIRNGVTDWAVTPTWPVGRVTVAQITDGTQHLGEWSLFRPDVREHSSDTALVPPQVAGADATALLWRDVEWVYPSGGSNVTANIDIEASRVRVNKFEDALASGFTDWHIELDGRTTISSSDLVVDRVSGVGATRWSVFWACDPDRSSSAALARECIANADVTSLSWTSGATSLGVSIRASRTAVPRMADLDRIDSRISSTWTSITNYVGWLENYATNNNRMAYMANSRVKDVELWRYTNSVTRADIRNGVTDWAVTPTWPVGRVVVAQITDGTQHLGEWSLFRPDHPSRSYDAALVSPQAAGADVTRLQWRDVEWTWRSGGSNVTANIDIEASRVWVNKPLIGARMPAVPTQNELTTAVQLIFSALGGMVDPQ